jgi:hypothetical protein
MKTLCLSMLLCSIISCFVYGQDSLKVIGGRFTTELNINPFQGELSLNNALNQIKVRYFLSDNTALRIGLSLSARKSTIENSTVYGTNPSNQENEKKTSTVGLNFGFEKHFKGTKRLSPYLSAELVVASKSSSHTVKTKSQTNTPNVTETKIKGAWQTTIFNNNGYPLYGYEERAFFQYGMNLVGGFDFYVARNFYVGYEIAFALLKTKYKNIDITTKPASTNPSPDSTQKDFSIGPNLINGIRVGFAF